MNKTVPQILAVLATCAALLCSGNVLAWSAEGHRIVARIAEAGLTPAARAEVDRLLAGEPDPTLAGIAAWADEIREADSPLGKRTASWHYINFDGRCGFEPPRDCRGNNCLVTALNRNFLVLSQRQHSDADRGIALKFLVHFVGDVHQPLHASLLADKGGNDYQVNLDGKGSNLHRVWDGTILERSGLQSPAYAAKLLAAPALPEDATLGSDRPALEWALESCRLVESGGLYPPQGGHVIDDAFLDRHRPLAERRLREAGQRLAAMLNHALDAPPARP